MALTKEQIAAKTEELENYITEMKDVQGCLIPIMQKAQELFGYLSLETMQLISDRLDVPVSEIYGIATFYALFSLTPKGDNVISVCTGTACYVKGSGEIIEECSKCAAAVLDAVKKQLGIEAGETTPDGKFSIQDTRCLGCCGLAPVMTVDGDVYGRLTPADVKDILAKY